MGFIETLLIKNSIQNVELHNKRMNQTREYFYNLPKIDLKEYIKIIPNKRVRVLYDKNILKIEYFDLIPREFKTFKIVKADIDYNFKSEDRKKLNNLKVKGYDEIIIVKNGFITDTTISNLAFWNGKEWHTPKTPLLKGTKREELLNKKFLIEKDIHINNLKNYSRFAMMNAIIEFHEIGGLECIKL